MGDGSPQKAQVQGLGGWGVPPTRWSHLLAGDGSPQEVWGYGLGGQGVLCSRPVVAQFGAPAGDGSPQ